MAPGQGGPVVFQGGVVGPEAAGKSRGLRREGEHDHMIDGQTRPDDNEHGDESQTNLAENLVHFTPPFPSLRIRTTTIGMTKGSAVITVATPVGMSPMLKA